MHIELVQEFELQHLDSMRILIFWIQIITTHSLWFISYNVTKIYSLTLDLNSPRDPHIINDFEENLGISDPKFLSFIWWVFLIIKNFHHWFIISEFDKCHSASSKKFDLKLRCITKLIKGICNLSFCINKFHFNEKFTWSSVTSRGRFLTKSVRLFFRSSSVSSICSEFGVDVGDKIFWWQVWDVRGCIN